MLQRVALASPNRCAGLLLTNSIGYDSWPIMRAKIVKHAGPAVRRLPLALFRAVFADMRSMRLRAATTSLPRTTRTRSPQAYATW